jgi:hypothetical protein
MRANRKTSAKKSGVKEAEAVPLERSQVVSVNGHRKARIGYVRTSLGHLFIVARPSPKVAIRYGRLPQTYLNKAQNAKTPEDGMAILREMSEEELDTLTVYASAVLCDISRDPLIREGGGEDALDPLELDGEDFWELFAWAVNGGGFLDGEGGELTTEELLNFRGQPELSADVSPNGASIWWQTQSTARNL